MKSMATMNVMTADGEIIVRMTCLHGTDELKFPHPRDGGETIGQRMYELLLRHQEAFACQCGVGKIVNGDDELQ